ncbi:hypothetical protein METBIDRAFT_116248 [Metschnikowia bicuspidata var. bicuspidata NRRL YB-4993]|uniref:Uncharacterized protein n=1 Tax=Metschnikowia bicuspidata var. bicuspidata NRRL YB-4993 TaxID=869754 RepID=A0A1A0HJL0_9ASCO|nr:hypothetical protein METBIDRAFT_116248 [Metschnikowia bicuspidata var. bicuspidata NRRL YB-4993]OBA24023.1 hypothetical protein METBIDRAFT_116248 [Metschnikowia bicuspidata var. bicuspidata NRRL YB-4993]
MEISWRQAVTFVGGGYNQWGLNEKELIPRLALVFLLVPSLAAVRVSQVSCQPICVSAIFISADVFMLANIQCQAFHNSNFHASHFIDFQIAFSANLHVRQFSMSANFFMLTIF